MTEASVAGVAGAGSSQVAAFKALPQRPQSAGVSRTKARPGSAQACRQAVPKPCADRSVGIWSDPKMKTLQAFARKKEVPTKKKAAAGRPSSASVARSNRLSRTGSDSSFASERIAGCEMLDKKVKELAKMAQTQPLPQGAEKLGSSASFNRTAWMSSSTINFASTAPAAIHLSTSLGDSQAFRRSLGSKGTQSMSSFASATGTSVAGVQLGNSSSAASLASQEASQHEAMMQRLQHFDTQTMRDRHTEKAERQLRRLFVDVDLAREFGPEVYSHKARCDHVDKVYDWYERHAKPQARREKSASQLGIVSPWLVVKKDEAPPPGSMRVAKYPGPSPLLSTQQSGSMQKSISTPALGPAAVAGAGG
eukprot:TRINITY_DN42945_c0_g1_i1.p1 TRINITY_DN42945_c0_g1~~TRINITY_DN42945_c0_g1_i1.p1  ORF type:complete len:365 (+),score=70.43 TRINITY_DN42945_c0_g1_i1:95-1189(+)